MSEDQTDENIPESFDEIISETILVSSNEIADEEINDNNFVDESPMIDDLVKNESIIDKPIIQNNDTEKINIFEIKETKIIHEKNNPNKILAKTEIKKQTNLSVEDIELGKLLNQINLECDSSIFIDMISYYDGMGPALYRLCNFDSSLNFFDDSLDKDPNNVEILVNKGSTLGKLGDFSKAIFYYDLALEIDSDFLPAKNNKANALANLGNPDDAILLYRQILDENPHSSTTEKNLKTAYSLMSTTTNEIEILLEFDIKKTGYSESSFFEKTQSINNEKQKPVNFFDQVNSALSSFSTLFGFLN